MSLGTGIRMLVTQWSWFDMMFPLLLLLLMVILTVNFVTVIVIVMAMCCSLYWKLPNSASISNNSLLLLPKMLTVICWFFIIPFFSFHFHCFPISFVWTRLTVTSQVKTWVLLEWPPQPQTSWPYQTMLSTWHLLLLSMAVVFRCRVKV